MVPLKIRYDRNLRFKSLICLLMNQKEAKQSRRHAARLNEALWWKPAGCVTSRSSEVYRSRRWSQRVGRGNLNQCWNLNNIHIHSSDNEGDVQMKHCHCACLTNAPLWRGPLKMTRCVTGWWKWTIMILVGAPRRSVNHSGERSSQDQPVIN